jgi:hypothetical protein
MFRSSIVPWCHCFICRFFFFVSTKTVLFLGILNKWCLSILFATNIFGTDAPVMTLVTTSYTVNVTGTLTIPCSYDANPNPTNVTWTKNSRIIDVINSGGKYTGSSLGTPSLTINALVRSDAGIYVCSAVNTVGPGFSSDVFVNVQCKHLFCLL